MSDYFKNLPHVLPSNHQEAANRLALMLEIPLAHVINANEQMIETIAGVILYRHLGRSDKEGVMRSIYKLSNKHLQQFLVMKVTDVIVNPTWGIWSLTTEELKRKKDIHQAFENIASLIGVGLNSLSLYDFVTKIRTNKGISLASRAGILATVIVWGAILYNKSELSRCNEEMEKRRPPMKGSPYYD